GVAEGATEAATVAEAEAVPAAAQEADLAEPDLAMPEPEEAPPLSPTVLRRFDHRNWRDRPGRLAATAPTAPRAAPTPGPEAPVPFGRRSERGTRYGGRQREPGEMAAPAQPAAASVPSVTAPPMP